MFDHAGSRWIIFALWQYCGRDTEADWIWKFLKFLRQTGIRHTQVAQAQSQDHGSHDGYKLEHAHWNGPLTESVALVY